MLSTQRSSKEDQESRIYPPLPEPRPTHNIWICASIHIDSCPSQAGYKSESRTIKWQQKSSANSLQLDFFAIETRKNAFPIRQKTTHRKEYMKMIKKEGGLSTQGVGVKSQWAFKQTFLVMQCRPLYPSTQGGSTVNSSARLFVQILTGPVLKKRKVKIDWIIVHNLKSRLVVQFFGCKTAERIRGRQCTCISKKLPRSINQFHPPIYSCFRFGLRISESCLTNYSDLFCHIR